LILQIKAKKTLFRLRFLKIKINKLLKMISTMIMNKKNLWIFIILVLSGISAQGQYLKSYDKDFVYQSDTCRITLKFGGAKFLTFADFIPTISAQYMVGNGALCTIKVIDDSTLVFKIPPISWSMVHSYFNLSLSGIDQYFVTHKLVDKLLFKELLYIPNSQIYCLPSNNIFDLDSIGSYAMLTLNGRGTHFLEPETEFGYEKALEGAKFTKIDSVLVVSDTLAYLFFPKPKENIVANYGIQYRNKKDGPRISFSSITFKNTMFGEGKIKMEFTASPYRISKIPTVQSAMEVKLIENDYFNPDTLSRLIKPSIQIAENKGEILPMVYVTDSMVFDSFMLGGIYKKRAKFYYNIPIEQKLASGEYDIVFNHSQLSSVRLPAQIGIIRPQPELYKKGFTTPGRNFQIDILFKPLNANLDTNGIDFVFANNPHVKIDSVKEYNQHYFLYGHADTLALSGNFNLHIRQANRPEIFMEDALRISQSLAVLVRFYPHNRLLPGRIDSSKYLTTDFFAGIKLEGKMPNIRFLKDGNLFPNISVTAAPDFNSNFLVYFQVDSTVLPGYYDAEVFDTLTNKWWLQKEAVYVMGSVRAKQISPNVIAASGVDYRQFTCWFEGSHFTQAKDIRAGESYTAFTVINDTCLTFKGINGIPAFYNDVDGYIGNDFTMTVVPEPSLTQFTPNWIAKGTKKKYTLHADASSWSAFPDHIIAHFERESEIEQNLIVSNYSVVNDTTLEIDVEATDSIKPGFYDLLLYQTKNFLWLKKANALNAITTSLNPIKNTAIALPQIYPNPSNGMLQGEFSNAQFSKLEILSLEGKLLYSEALTGKHFLLNLQGILPASGIYLLQLSGTQNFTQKIIFNP
jgi:hypothetical protein